MSIPAPNSIYSLRFERAGSATASFYDNQFIFTLPYHSDSGTAFTGSPQLSLGHLTSNHVTTVVKAVIPGNIVSLAFVADGAGAGSLTNTGAAYIFHFANGVTTVGNFETLIGTSADLAVVTSGTLATVLVTGDAFSTHNAEAVVWSPLANGVLLGPFTGTLANVPISATPITLHWTEVTVAKSATVTGTSTIGGANAANLSAVLLNPVTGSLSITFAGGHPPDTSSLTVDYITAVYLSGGADAPTQAWSKGMRIGTSGADLEFSFDGVNVHGKVLSGATGEYLNRVEGGIYVRGAGATYILEAW